MPLQRGEVLGYDFNRMVVDFTMFNQGKTVRCAISTALLGAQRDGRATPAETDIGVMAFALGELADLLHEGKRFPEIAESKRALDAVGFIAQLPIRSLRLEA
jgi:hypothetical protein